jgi:hypothetical protein
MAFVIKAEIRDPRAKTFAFTAHKTMYGGKHIAEGDTAFLFASENEGGQGLFARAADAARERHHQADCASETAVGTKRAQTLQQLEGRLPADRAQLQALPAGNEQNHRNHGRDGRVSGLILLARPAGS